jgi:hypothetical protein
VRGTGSSACASDDAASLGKVPLAITELTGSITSLAGFATGLGLDLDALDFLQTAMLEEAKGWMSKFDEGET